AKTYNTRDSLVVTHPTTNLAVCSLSMGEQTGSRILCSLWSYVPEQCVTTGYMLLNHALSLDRNTQNKGGRSIPKHGKNQMYYKTQHYQEG
ncbi:uncharacterized protein BCR38DRAFT_351782, partial [Pseudomassariella vexata]